MLLKHGADIYVQDKDDKSVLYWAAAQNHQNVLRVGYCYNSDYCDGLVYILYREIDICL